MAAASETALHHGDTAAALAPLRGWAWWLYLPAWAVLLTAAIVGSVMSIVERTDYIAVVHPEVEYGLWLPGGGPTPRVGLVMGAQAERSGIRPGDRVVAIASRPIAAYRGEWRRRLASGSGAPMIFAVIDRQGAMRQHPLSRDDRHFAEAMHRSGTTLSSYRTAMAVLDLLLRTVIPLATAAILLVRRPRDPLTPWVSLAAILTALVFGQSRFWYITQPFPLNQVDWLAPTPLILMTVALFPDARFSPRLTWLAVAMVPLTVLTRYWGVSSLSRNAIVLALGIFAAGLVIVRFRRMSPGGGRQQIRWVLFGFATSIVALALGLAAQFVQRQTGDPATLFTAGAAATVLTGANNAILIVALAFGLMRYRLYDAEATISRSVAYGALTVFLLAIFAGSEKVIEALGEEYFGSRLGALAGGIGAAFAAAMIVPLHHRVNDWAEKRFRSRLVHLREGLPLLVGDLRETATPHALAETVLARVANGVRAIHGAILLHDQVVGTSAVEHERVVAWSGGHVPGHGDGLHVDKTDMLFPMRVALAADGVGAVGWLLLGPRPDGSFYGSDEREALAGIADPVARALAIAAERERRHAARIEGDERLDRQNATLQAAIARLHQRIDLVEQSVGGPMRATPLSS